MTFELSLQELTRLHNWLEIHNKECSHASPLKQGASGGRLTYSFTPTTLGTVTTVKCACGQEIDLTDYDW